MAISVLIRLDVVASLESRLENLRFVTSFQYVFKILVMMLSINSIAISPSVDTQRRVHFAFIDNHSL